MPESRDVLTPRFRHFAVALANDDTDAGLIAYAARVAAIHPPAVVDFIHVVPAQPQGGNLSQSLKERVDQHFVGVPGSPKVYCDVRHGPLLDQLLLGVAEHQSDVLFVGHRRAQPGRRALARRLAMKAPCSVWLVPEGSRPGFQRLLVPIDFSDHSADALRVATALAGRVPNADCLALHVYFNEARVSYPEYDQVLRGQESEAFRKFIANVDNAGVSVTPQFVEESTVAPAIHRIAEEQGADLIVMATRGRSRSAAVLLGSATEDALIETRLPLLAVKHFGARLGVLQALFDRGFHRRPDLQFD